MFPNRRIACPNPECAGTAFDEVTLSRRGRVWSHTTNHYPPPAPFVAAGVRVVPLRRRRRALRWLTWIAIARIVVATRARIVHAHDPELFPLLALLRLTGRTAICDVHENVAEQVRHKEWIPSWCRAPLAWTLNVAQRALPFAVDAVILAEDSYRRDFPAAPNVSVVRNFPPERIFNLIVLDAQIKLANQRIQAELAVAEREWKEWAIARSKVGEVLAPENETGQDHTQAGQEVPTAKGRVPMLMNTWSSLSPSDLLVRQL